MTFATALADAMQAQHDQHRPRPMAVVEPTEPDSEGRRIGAVNNKGGVGKTWVLLALAEAIAETGQRVLVVDMDPQANATRRLGVTNPTLTLTDVLRPGVSEGAAGAAIRRCEWRDPVGQYIDVLPAGFDLEDRVPEAGLIGAVQRLATALVGVDDSYAVTLLDCPPSLGHLTQMVLATLYGPDDTVILPLEPEQDAVAGAMRAHAFITQHRAALGVPRLYVGGLVVNRVRPTALHTGRVAQLRTTFPEVPILGSPIPLRAGIATVQDSGEPMRSDPELRDGHVLFGVREIAMQLELREDMEEPA